MDPISAVLLTFGAIILFASWIQLLFTSFNEDFSWGLATLFVPPLSYLYALFSLDKAKSALGLAATGGALVIFGL